MKATSWVSLLALVLLAGVVVGTSLQGTAGMRCEVCLEFAGHRVCRTVDADTAEAARHGAVTNACALLARGVTETLACERTPPLRITCQPR